MTDEPTGNSCPGCGQPAALQLSEQCWCGNDDCHVLTWNPTLTLAENVADVGEIHLPDIFQ